MGSQQKNLNNIAKLSPIVLVTISLTRIWAISLYYIFGKDSPTIERIINDPWHHYQVGLLLVILAVFFRKNKNSITLVAIGLGIFLEEWPVFFNDLGLGTNYLYHTKIDFIAIAGVVGLVYLISKTLHTKMTLKSV